MESNQKAPTTFEIIVGYIKHPRFLFRMLYTKWLITRAVSYQMIAQRFIDRSKKVMGDNYKPLPVGPINPTVGYVPDNNLYIVAMPNPTGIRLYGFIARTTDELRGILEATFPGGDNVYLYDIASLRQFVFEDDNLRAELFHSYVKQEKATWN